MSTKSSLPILHAMHLDALHKACNAYRKAPHNLNLVSLRKVLADAKEYFDEPKFQQPAIPFNFPYDKV